MLWRSRKDTPCSFSRYRCVMHDGGFSVFLVRNRGCRLIGYLKLQCYIKRNLQKGSVVQLRLQLLQACCIWAVTVSWLLSSKLFSCGNTQRTKRLFELLVRLLDCHGDSWVGWGWTCSISQEVVLPLILPLHSTHTPSIEYLQSRKMMRPASESTLPVQSTKQLVTGAVRNPATNETQSSEYLPLVPPKVPRYLYPKRWVLAFWSETKIIGICETVKPSVCLVRAHQFLRGYLFLWSQPRSLHCRKHAGPSPPGRAEWCHLLLDVVRLHATSDIRCPIFSAVSSISEADIYYRLYRVVSAWRFIYVQWW